MNQKLADPEIAILTDLLARTDALFTPPRVYGDETACLPFATVWPAVVERREVFFTQGIDVPFAGSAAARKESERLVGRLASMRLVTIGSKSGRRVGLRLTRRGDDVTRWLAAVPMLYEAWPLLERVHTIAEATGYHLVRETDIADTDYDQPDVSAKLSNLLDMLLPAKAAGLVDDHADMNGRCWYGLTLSGRKWLDGPAPSPPNYLPEYPGPQWCDLHTRLLRRYEAERLGWQPKHQGHIVIPLSAGLGPSTTWRDLEASNA